MEAVSVSVVSSLCYPFPMCLWTVFFFFFFFFVPRVTVCFLPVHFLFDYPILVQILELYTEMTRDGREIVFIWVPGHVGIGGK